MTEDQTIIKMFFERSEQAIRELEQSTAKSAAGSPATL